MLIVAGSYERLLYGLSFSSEEKSISPVFIYPSHISCIKTIASGGRFLASGSSDEQVKLYDLKLRKEIGSIMHHQGSITCLQFYGKSHLVSGSEDGEIVLHRTKDWEILKTLKGHKGSVSCFSIHPTGKILLSVGKDSTLKLWDLMRGVCVKNLKMSRVCDSVVWNEEGSKYATCSETIVEMFDINQSEAISCFKNKYRINCIRFAYIKDQNGMMVEVLLAAGEDKCIHVIQSPQSDHINPSTDMTLLATLNLNCSTRIKDMDTFTEESNHYLAICTSDGTIKLINMSFLTIQTEFTIIMPEIIAEYSTGSRLTCLRLIDSQYLGTIKPETVKESIASEVESEYEVRKEERVVVEFEGKEIENKVKFDTLKQKKVKKNFKKVKKLNKKQE